MCAFDAGVVPFAVDGRKLCECLTSKLSVGQLSFTEGEARAIAYIGHQFFEGYAPTTLVLHRLVDEALLAVSLCKAALQIATKLAGQNRLTTEILPACRDVTLN